MTKPEEILEMLRATPFQHLKFTFSDGTYEIVRHPENASVTRGSVLIAQFQSNAEIPDFMKTYSLAHVLSIEPMHKQPS